MTRLYIAVLDEFPDYMTPTLVAHAVIGAHLCFEGDSVWNNWLYNSFKKCVVRVNQKEFDKIKELGSVYLAHENNTLEGRKACAVVRPYVDNKDVPNVLKFAKLWSPKNE
jgi:hypothetical protein